MPRPKSQIPSLQGRINAVSPRTKRSISSLPLGARLRIYKLALIFRDEKYGCPEQFMIGVGNLTSPASPAVVRACRAIHSEAVPVLYEDNTFQLSWPVAAIRWLRTIGMINIVCLRTLRIFVEGVFEQSSRRGWYELFRKLGR